ncbi:MAG: MBL fold metallo-hydrolase [Paludibacteraceae bacterium]|nr:MBL fold metallo-hydrolase [Paludibacteraceae bacterium]
MLTIKSFVFNYIQENTYVLSDETREAAIIDAGCMDDAERKQLTDYITEQGLTVKLLLNTHLHFDHAIGNNFVNKHYGVKPLAHQADAFFPLHQREQLESFGFQNIVDEPALPVNDFISDGQVLQFGNTMLKVIHTPGHSPGSVCFWCEEEHLLFSGDTLFRLSVGRTDFEQGSTEQLMQSLQRLALLPPGTKVLPGHGPATTIRTEVYANPYMRSADE